MARGWKENENTLASVFRHGIFKFHIGKAREEMWRTVQNGKYKGH